MSDGVLPFGKDAPREFPTPEKRKPLTRIQFATLILQQNGRCGCGCGERLIADQIVDEHLNPLNNLGSNDLENRSLWRRECSQKKTDEIDKPRAAKTKRIRGETCNGPKRSIPSRDIQGRKFQKKPEGYKYQWGKRQ